MAQAKKVRKGRRRPKPDTPRAKVSTRSARGGQKPFKDSMSTTRYDHALAEASSCDGILNPTTVFLKRKRKKAPYDTYNVVITKGEKCGALAIISFYKEGKRVHRCAQHISQ